MPFKVWDNHFGGYMRDIDGREAELDVKGDSDRAIEQFIRTRSQQERWLCRLDVHHMEANLCYHLTESGRLDALPPLLPRLLPIYFDGPATDWKLLAEDGSEMNIGMVVTSFRGEKFVLAAFQPPHKMAASGRVFVRNAKGEQLRYGARIFGGEYEYVPPETALTAEGLRWAAARSWDRARPIDIPPARELVLPPEPHWPTLYLRKDVR